MDTTSTNLNNIACKLRPFRNDQWYAYLTPAEAVALEDAGALAPTDWINKAQNGALKTARIAAERGLEYYFWYYVDLPRDSEARRAVRRVQRV